MSTNSVFGLNAPYVWIGTSLVGNWSDSANWKDGLVPNGPDTVVLIASQGLTSSTGGFIRLDVNVTVGKLILVSNRTNSPGNSGGNLKLMTENGTSANSSAAGTTKLTFEATSGRAELYMYGDGQGNPAVMLPISLNSDLNIVCASAISTYSNGFYIVNRIELNGKKLYRHGRGALAFDSDNSTSMVAPGEIHIRDTAVTIRYQANRIGSAKIYNYIDGSPNHSVGVIGWNNYQYYQHNLSDTTVANDIEFVREVLPSYAGTATRGISISGPLTSAKAVFTGAWSGNLYPASALGYNATISSQNAQTRAIRFGGSEQFGGQHRFGIWLDGNHSGLTVTQDTARGVFYISQRGAPIKLGANWTPPNIYRLRIGGRSDSVYDNYCDTGFLIDSPRTITPTLTEFDVWGLFGDFNGNTVTAGSTTVAMPGNNAVYLAVGAAITSAAFPAGTTIVAIPNQRTLVMSNPATVSSSNTTITSARPRFSSYPMFGVSHTTGSSVWNGNLSLNFNSHNTTNGSVCPTTLYVPGTATCTFSGNVIGSGTVSGQFNPIYKMGTGEAIFSGTASTVALGRILVREGALTINGTFSATGANATNFLVGLTKYSLEFNEVAKNGQEIQPVVNGTTLSNLVYSSNDPSGSGFYGEPTSGARPFIILLRVMAHHPDIGIIWCNIDSVNQNDDWYKYKRFEVFPTGHSALPISFNTNAGSTLTYTYTEVGPAVAALRGTGTIAGSVTVMDHANASVEPGSSASPYGTLTVGSLSAGASSNLKFAVSGASNSKITVNGAYTAQGTFVITGTLQAGTYDLITCTGTLTAGTTSLDTSLASGFSSATLNVNVASKKVQLVVT